MAESERIAIIDKDGGNRLADIVESTTNPGVFGLVILKPNGSNI